MLPPKGKYRVPEDCNWNTAPGMEVSMVMIMAARLLSEIVGKEKVVGVDVTGAVVRDAVETFNSCDSFVRVSHGGHPHPSFEKYYLNPDFDEEAVEGEEQQYMPPPLNTSDEVPGPSPIPEPLPEADYE